jgi:hypothetical protein
MKRSSVVLLLASTSIAMSATEPERQAPLMYTLDHLAGEYFLYEGGGFSSVGMPAGSYVSSLRQLEERLAKLQEALTLTGVPTVQIQPASHLSSRTNSLMNF